MPEVNGQTSINYERYFIFNKEGIEITKNEFEQLKKLSIGEIIRESYLIDEISVKVYSRKHTGLIRA